MRFAGTPKCPALSAHRTAKSRAPAKSGRRGPWGQLLTAVNNCKQTAREARRRSALPQPLPRRPAEPIGEPERGHGGQQREDAGVGRGADVARGQAEGMSADDLAVG